MLAQHAGPGKTPPIATASPERAVRAATCGLPAPRTKRVWPVMCCDARGCRARLTMVIAQAAGFVVCAGAERPCRNCETAWPRTMRRYALSPFERCIRSGPSAARGGIPARNSQVLDCTIQDESFRVNIAYQARLAENPGKLVSRTLLVTKDKRDCRQLLRGENTDRLFGLVLKSARVPWAADPATLNLNRWSPFRYLAAAQVFVDGSEQLDGIATMHSGGQPMSRIGPVLRGGAATGLHRSGLRGHPESE